MKGIELSERYYREACAPMLVRRFPDLVHRIAAGLVGEGSECMGFDDALSQDHDWGAAICLWLDTRDHETHGEALRHALAELPEYIGGHPVRRENGRIAGRSGVLEIGQFYFRYLGHTKVPDTLLDWLAISEENLACATNGVVFADPSGQFTGIRSRLLNFYPEDVRLKKIAARCARIARAGQYNFPRCVARREYVAAVMAEAAFMDAVCSAVFLLNRCYKPFFKWMHKAMLPLPLLGREVFCALSDMVGTEDGRTRDCDKKVIIIENVSTMIARELERQCISDAKGNFLLDHAFSVQSRICDNDMRSINVFLG